jgi:nitrite reductase/ring-hydroxylating ferredoxin subunit
LLQLSNGHRVILLQDGESWKAVQANCPHLDIDLMDGHCEKGGIYCPAHGVAFKLSSGQSASPLLRLRTYELRFEAAALRIKAKESLS